jgi:hypothetical protein
LPFGVGAWFVSNRAVVLRLERPALEATSSGAALSVV